MKARSALLCTCLTATAVFPARATTVSFSDLTDGPVVVTTSLSPGVTLLSSIASSERANVVLLVPKNLFIVPAGGALAALLEPAGESGDSAGSISDLVTLSVSPGAPGTNVDGVTIGFRSDTAGLIFAPVPGAIVEDGTLQRMDGAFTTPNPNGGGPRLPYALPAGFSIQAQSDVVPEPSTLWLAAPGLAPLVASVIRRVRAPRRA